MSALPKLSQPTKTKGHVSSLLSFIKSKNKDDLEKFATSCGTTTNNLLQIAYGGSVSAKLSKKINTESKGLILLSELRPDIFS